MNALGNPIGSTGGVQREQTMEEILASIRKIIESNEAITAPQDGEYAALETSFENQTPAVVPQVQAPVVEAAPSLQSEMAKLVSQSPERRVAAAFDDLNSAFIKSKQMPMEGVAEAMLRPMMQDWLDNNLPNLVERLVREEIARIARGDI